MPIRRRRTVLPLLAALLASLLGAGMLRDGAEAQERNCTRTSYASLRPSAVLAARPNPVASGAAVTLDGSASRPNAGPRIVRWDFDLDGDGAYETTGPSATATRSYTGPGQVTVRMVVVDACGFTSAPATVRVAVAAQDLKAPSVRISGRRTASLRTLPRRGLRLTARCGEPCALAFSAAVDTRTRRRLGLRRATVGRSRVVLPSTRPRTVKIAVRLPRAARRRAGRVRSGRITVRVGAIDAAGNRRTVRRTVRLTR